MAGKKMGEPLDSPIQILHRLFGALPLAYARGAAPIKDQK